MKLLNPGLHSATVCSGEHHTGQQRKNPDTNKHGNTQKATIL